MAGDRNAWKSSSWMHCDPQRVKGIDDDDDDDDSSYMYRPNRRAIFRLIFE
jgi:hypothetical protein